MSSPEQYEFRVSPDRRQFAIWEPGNEPWFAPEAAMQGRWITSADMERLGWVRYVPEASADQAAVLRKAADVAERLMDERYGHDCSYAIGGLDVARELRRMADETATTDTDTLPSWLHWRFGPHGQPWAEVPDDDKLLWEHQARAVRRAVARGGFKQPAAGARQDGADHVCNTVQARGEMDEPLGYLICGYCGTPKNGARP